MRESGELRIAPVAWRDGEVVEFCAALPGPTRVAYEAGPTGYGLARALHAAGDRLRGGGAGEDRAPGAGQGQDRSARRRAGAAAVDDRRRCTRCGSRAARRRRCATWSARARTARRSDARPPAAEQAAAAPRRPLRGHRQRVDARHRAWLTKLDLGGGAQATLLDYLGAIDALVIRRDALEATIAELVPGSPWAQTVARLRCLRGIDTLSRSDCAPRSATSSDSTDAGRLMSYVGLVPVRETAPARRAARARSPRPAPGTPAGCWSRPPGTTASRQPAAPALQRRQDGQPAHDHRDLLAGATPPAPRLAATRRRSAASAARSSRSPSPASSPASAGRSPAPTEPAPTAPRRLRRRRATWHHAREHPRSKHEQPHRATLDLRQQGSHDENRSCGDGSQPVHPRIRGSGRGVLRRARCRRRACRGDRSAAGATAVCRWVRPSSP